MPETLDYNDLGFDLLDELRQLGAEITAVPMAEDGPAAVLLTFCGAKPST